MGLRHAEKSTETSPVNTAASTTDNRLHNRQSCNTTITYTIKKVVGQFSGQLTGQGILVNTSDGGIQFKTSNKFGRGSLLIIDNPSTNPKRKNGKVRVLRCEKASGVHDYLIAGEYI